MKKIYPLLFFSLFSFSVIAQLNGSYQIGGTAPDYASLNSAINALHSQGINGPVTFNVEPGTYNEQLNIGFIPGSNQNDTILFTSSTGDPKDVKIEFAHASPDNYILKFDSTAYVSFSRVTFRSLSTDGQVIELSNAVQGIRLQENLFLAPPNVNQIFRDEPDTGNPSKDIYILDNTFKGGRTGVEIDNHYYNDSKYALIKGNEFINQKFGAISLTNFDDLFSSNNESIVIIADNKILYDTTISYSYTAIYLRHIYDSLNVNNNIVRANVGDFGFKCIDQDNNGGVNKSKVWYNNIFDINVWHSGGSAVGLVITNGSFHKFIHNTFVLKGEPNSTLTGVYVGFSGGGADLINNDFTLLGSNSANYMRLNNSNPGLGIVDHNNLFTEGNVFAELDGSNAVTFSDYQDSTGFDLNSLNQMSGVAIHDTGSVGLCSYDLYGGGVPTFVGDDYRGDSRSGTSPTPGAIEVYSNAPSVSSQASFLSGCQFMDDTLSSGDYSNGDYHWERGMDTLGWGQEVIVDLPDTGAYYVLKWEHGICQASDSVFVQSYPAPQLMMEDTGFCAGDSVTLDAGDWASYQWDVGDTTQTISVDSSRYYYLEVTDSNGCKDGSYVYAAKWNLPVIDSVQTMDATCSSCCNGVGVVYPADDSSSLDFLWTSGSTNDTVTDLCVGQVTVTVTDSNGCSMTDTTTVDFATGQKELSLSSGMELYPNPSSGTSVKVKIKGGLQKVWRGRVIDLEGREVIAFQLPVGIRSHELSLPKEASGIYYLELSNEHQVMMEKLVVE